MLLSLHDWGNIAMGALIVLWSLCHLNKCYGMAEMEVLTDKERIRNSQRPKIKEIFAVFENLEEQNSRYMQKDVDRFLLYPDGMSNAAIQRRVKFISARVNDEIFGGERS